jgi:hypothetical protein
MPVSPVFSVLKPHDEQCTTVQLKNNPVFGSKTDMTLQEPGIKVQFNDGISGRFFNGVKDV